MGVGDWALGIWAREGGEKRGVGLRLGVKFGD